LLNKTRLAVAVLVSTSLLASGCAPPVIFAGAAAGATVASDERTAGTVVEDQAIEIKAARAIGADPTLADQVHVSVTSYNNVVLLTGQAPSKQQINKVVGVVQTVEKVARIHNEITVGPPTSFKQRSSDTWITTRVKSALLGAKGFEATKVKVVTENGSVFLMGLIPRDQAANIAATVQQVNGVKRVVKIFEYLD